MDSYASQRIAKHWSCDQFPITGRRKFDGSIRCKVDDDSIDSSGCECFHSTVDHDRALAVLSLQRNHVRRNAWGDNDAGGSAGLDLVS